jgi:hypothetical protein
MTSELAPIDIRQVPELARLVDEVRTSRKPRRIVRDDEEVAILMPPTRRPRPGRVPSAADLAAFRAAAGSWKDHLDPEEFKRQREALQVDDTPPRRL